MWAAAVPRCQRSLPPTMRHSPHFSILSRDRPLHTFRSDPYSHNYTPTSSNAVNQTVSHFSYSSVYDPSATAAGGERDEAVSICRSQPQDGQHLRVFFPETTATNDNDSSQCDSHVMLSPGYGREFRAYNSRYQPQEDSSMLANETSGHEDSITATSSRMYTQYNTMNPNNQPLTFHHSNYPTRNYNYCRSTRQSTSSLHLDAANSQFVNLDDDVRVELSYSQRDFRRGAGVIGDAVQPNTTPSGAIVAPSYQQIEGVGYERGRDWAGRPLLEVGMTTKSVIGVIAFSTAFVCLVMMSLKVGHTYYD